MPVLVMDWPKSAWSEFSALIGGAVLASVSLQIVYLVGFLLANFMRL